MKIKVIMVFFCIFLIGCQQNNLVGYTVACESPMINIGGECCFDENKNLICDDLEKEKLEAQKRLEASKKPENVTKPKPSYISLAELENGINKTYYPIKRLNFENVNRTNLTGIEATYDLRSAGRFNILKIKKDYNFLYTEDNFTNFIKNKHSVEVKNNEISSQAFIDYRELSYPTWQGATLTYDHGIQETKVMGKPAFFEKHIVFYGVDDALLDLWFAYYVDVWCTSELIVEVHPSETFIFYYEPGNAVQANVNHISKLMREQNDFMIKEAEKILKICSGNVEPLKFIKGEFVFYGTDGYYPIESSIKAGEKVIIHNENDFNNAEIFTFIGAKTGKSFISGEINYTSYGEVVIKDSDTYTILNPEYADSAKIIVE